LWVGPGRPPSISIVRASWNREGHLFTAIGELSGIWTRRSSSVPPATYPGTTSDGPLQNPLRSNVDPNDRDGQQFHPRHPTTALYQWSNRDRRLEAFTRSASSFVFSHKNEALRSATTTPASRRKDPAEATWPDSSTVGQRAPPKRQVPQVGGQAGAVLRTCTRFPERTVGNPGPPSHIVGKSGSGGPGTGSLGVRGPGGGFFLGIRNRPTTNKGGIFWKEAWTEGSTMGWLVVDSRNQRAASPPKPFGPAMQQPKRPGWGRHRLRGEWAADPAIPGAHSPYAQEGFGAGDQAFSRTGVYPFGSRRIS